ncbi:hypothetical protein [Rhizobium sp. 2TAF27]
MFEKNWDHCEVNSIAAKTKNQVFHFGRIAKTAAGVVRFNIGA